MDPGSSFQDYYFVMVSSYSIWVSMFFSLGVCLLLDALGKIDQYSAYSLSNVRFRPSTIR